MNVPARNSTFVRRVQADVPLSDSVVDFTDKVSFLPEPPYIVPSQQQQEPAAVSPPQDPFTCLISHGIHLGDFVAIMEDSFACTGREVLHWTPKSHMVELGSIYEIPELNHLGRKKRVAVVSERFTVELPNASLPYLPFWENLDRLVPTTAGAKTHFAKLIQTPVNAFPESVRRIVCGKAIYRNTGKTYPEVGGLCVVEYELVTPPTVQSPTHSPTSSPPNSSLSSSPSSSSSSSSTSTSSQSPPPSHTSLEWKANFGYPLNVSSANQEYKTSTANATGDRPKIQHILTLNLGIDYPTQSFFAIQQPRIHYDDPSVFSMNSVEQPTGCCRFQGFSVTRRDLSKRHKLIFKTAKYIHQAQKSTRSARIKAASPPNRSVPRRILAAISPPTSITPGIFATARNSDSSSSSSAGVSSSTSSASGSPSNSGASWSPSSVSFDASASSFSAGLSANASPSPPPPRSPARRRRRRRGRSPSSSSASGESPTVSRNRIYCPRPKCWHYVHSDKALHAHTLYKHDKLRMYKCEYFGCECAYPRKGNLTTHIKSKHKKDELRKCEKCGKALSREYNTVRHERTCTGVASGRNIRRRRLSE